MEKKLEELKKLLKTFHMATDIPLTVLDAEQKKLAQFGEEYRYCNLLREDTHVCQKCLQCHEAGGRQAFATGACYFFDCHCRLTLFAVPLVDAGRFAGYVLGGPVLLDYPDIAAVEDTVICCGVPKGCKALLYSEIKNILMLDPKKAYYLGELLFQTVSRIFGTDSEEYLSDRRKQGIRQKQIAESIQEKKDGKEYNYAYHVKQEQELAEYVERGDLPKASFLLNDILGGIYFSSGSNIELIRIRITELITILTRRLVRRGVDTEKLYKYVNDFQRKSAGSKNLLDLSEALGKLLPALIEMIHSAPNSGASAEIRSALQYVNEHYQSDLPEGEVAEYLSVSKTWFSRRFKQEMGIGYAAYLTRIRLNKAKQLLEETDLEVAEIAQRTGFGSQQYFTRVFSNHIKMSPGAYRKKHQKK